MVTRFLFLAVVLVCAVGGSFCPEAAAGVTPQFDADAATQVWLDQVHGVEREQSDAYFEGGYWLLLWGALVAFAADLLLMNLRWSARFSAFAARVTGRRWLQTALYSIPYVLVLWLLLLPWVVYADFFREQQYALMNLTFTAWLVEEMISLVVSTIAVAIFLMVLFAVIRRFERTWWLFGTGVTIAFLLLGMMLAPVYLSPLFNKYTQLPDGELRNEIVAMANAHDVPADNIYVFDQSKQHDRISANVSGFLQTMRISLNDNLLNGATPAEVKSVMGHELGHYVLGHVWRNIVVLGLVYGFCLFLLAALTPRLLLRWGERWQVTAVSDPAVLPVFGMILTVALLLLTPVTNSLIRINESEADAFGLDAAREPDGFASIAMKLAKYRKIEPGALEEMVLFDHPSGKTRVAMSMQWKAEHLEDAATPNR